MTVDVGRSPKRWGLSTNAKDAIEITCEEQGSFNENLKCEV